MTNVLQLQMLSLANVRDCSSSFASCLSNVSCESVQSCVSGVSSPTIFH